jgi:mono/diheme cytochrome c family protein
MRGPDGARVVVASALLLFHLSAAEGAPQQSPGGRNAAAVQDHRAWLDRYCVTCHNQTLKIPAGNPLLLDAIDVASPGRAPENWEKVVRKLRTGAMPPAGRPRPSQSEVDAFSSWLEAELDSAAGAQPNPGRVPAVHRLSRTEYQNAVRHLLALDDLPKELEIETLLPSDNTVGFDTAAELLFVTPTLMEGYVAAARKISRLAVGDPQLPEIVDIYRLPLELPQDAQLEELPLGTRGGTVIRRYFPLDGEYLFKLELSGSTREAHDLELSLDGERMKLFTVGGNGPEGRARGSRFEGEGSAPLDVRLHIRAGPRTVGVTFVGKTSAADEALVRPFRRGMGQQPAVAAVTIRGPLGNVATGDTPSRRRIFVCQPTNTSDEEPCARRIVATLLRRAYRRAVSDTDVSRVLAFYHEGRRDGGFDNGIERALERVLVSPEFLLRTEYPPRKGAPGSVYSVSDVELASRLSFFIWSSIPDDELLDVALSGKLRQPGMLEKQTRRLLADPRSHALVTNFAAQWLYLRDLPARRPNDRFFPDFDEGLRQAMLRETDLFFDSILREDRSVLDLLGANYTFVNERLARHYGLPGVYGSHFRRITLGEDSGRGGLLGQGSILTLTSYATRTSPVVRGKWILENILGAPPPPPPPNVPALKDTTSEGKVLSMRERMVQHRANPVCAACHMRMDPLGFALENFDAVGQWRTRSEAGDPIDPGGVLPDGTKIDGVQALRRVLLSRADQFSTTLTEKLLSYAVGREVGYHDRPAVRAVTRAAVRDHYRFSSLVVGIVTSVPFQMRVKNE